MHPTNGLPSEADMAELTRLNEEFTEQERRGAAGVDFFSDALADDLCFRRASGKVVDKQAYLEGLKDPENTNDVLTSEIAQVGVVEDWALVEVAVRLKGTRGGVAVDGTFNNLRVFERTSNGWKCVLWFNRSTGPSG